MRNKNTFLIFYLSIKFRLDISHHQAFYFLRFYNKTLNNKHLRVFIRHFAKSQLSYLFIASTENQMVAYAKPKTVAEINLKNTFLMYECAL
jgi:hypothetical protein